MYCVNMMEFSGLIFHCIVLCFKVKENIHKHRQILDQTDFFPLVDQLTSAQNSPKTNKPDQQSISGRFQLYFWTLWDWHKQPSNHQSSKEKLQPSLLFQTLSQAAHRNQIDRSAIPLSHTHTSICFSLLTISWPLSGPCAHS